MVNFINTLVRIQEVYRLMTGLSGQAHTIRHYTTICFPCEGRDPVKHKQSLASGLYKKHIKSPFIYLNLLYLVQTNVIKHKGKLDSCLRRKDV